MLEKAGNGAPPAGDADRVAWTGGVNVFATHTGSVLAAATVDRLASPATVFTWTVTGAAAQQLVDDWRAGNHPGLTLVDSGATAGRDYRSHCYGFNGTAARQPRLTIAYAEPPAIWQATAIAERTAEQAVVPEEIDLTAALGQVQAGPNVLAIHGLNSSATDPDFLILPELSGFTAVEDPANPGYLAADDVIFTVEASNDLQTWRTDEPVIRLFSTASQADGTAEWLFSAPTTSDPGYFRLKLTRRAPASE
ncbi:MAG: hypothetical protein K9N23_06480 [Akkermansiaceae bacterium]|nr:hypothetical protein [Akkermansiaceae bacterium]